jgi:hypothetical protein
MGRILIGSGFYSTTDNVLHKATGMKQCLWLSLCSITSILFPLIRKVS